MYLPFCVDDSGEEFHADMNHNRYLVNWINDTAVLGRYQTSHLAFAVYPYNPSLGVVIIANSFYFYHFIIKLS